MKAHSDLAREFIQHAEEFRQAAERLHSRMPFLYHPTFYMALHSIELGLKAYLAGAGVGKRRLASRDFGHDLGALVAEAHDAGAIPFLNAHDRKMITYGGKNYSKKCFEYPEFMVSTLPIGQWLRIAEALTSNAKF